MKKLLIITLLALAVSFYFSKDTANEKPIKNNQVIEKREVVPTLVKPNRVYDVVEEDAVPILVKPNRVYDVVEEEIISVLVKPKKSYKVETVKEKIKDEVREITAWDKMVTRVKHYESFKPKAYRCCGGKMTIGYGYTKDVKWGDVVTKEKALKLLEEELLEAKGHVLRIVKVPLKNHQLAALTSFTFNCGQGALRTLVSGEGNRLNHGNYESIKRIMPKYRIAGGKVRRGLELRRKWEVSLWSDET